MAYLLLLFAALAGVSFLIGMVIRRTGFDGLPGHLSHPTKAGPPITAVVLSAILSYFAFTAFNLAMPALNDPVFDATGSARLDRREASIQLQLSCEKVQGPLGIVQDVCRNVPTTFIRNIGIEIEFPKNVPVNEDFSVLARATSRPDFPDGIYQAELFKPTSIEARTSDACDNEQSADGVVSTACREITSSGLVDFRWALTPTQTGRAEIAIKTNTLDFEGATSANAGGAVSISYDGRTGAINAMEPTLALGDLELDGPRGEVRFPIQVLTTVGVDQATYDRLKIVGAVISALAALLGAGFLLKLTGASSED
ncbi:MAG: hypothetical protein AB3N17_17420 [Tateyamaria sp.]